MPLISGELNRKADKITYSNRVKCAKYTPYQQKSTGDNS